MKRAMPFDEQVEISSDGSASLDLEIEVNNGYNVNELSSEDALIRRAGMYQEYMKLIQIPTHRGSVIPFISWIGLGRSIKQLYGQSLHYLTNILLKQWDQFEDWQ